LYRGPVYKVYNFADGINQWQVSGLLHVGSKHILKDIKLVWMKVLTIVLFIVYCD
jgi:hypothetical protein